MSFPLAIVIPTYNERENVRQLVPRLFELYPQARVFIADDNSPDKTGDLVQKMSRRFPKLFLIRREKKEGIGRAYIHAFKQILPLKPGLVIQMDADFSHDPLIIKDMLTLAKKNDVVLGSRYITGISVINWALGRVLLSYFANVYVRKVTGMKIMDSTGGYKCFNRKVLESIHLDRIGSDGYSFQIEMNYAAWRLGFKIVETPIIFVDRQKGVSKMSKNIIWEALIKVLTLPLRRTKTYAHPLFQFNKKKSLKKK